MNFKKNFYENRRIPKAIWKNKLVVGCVMGLFFTIIFYSFIKLIGKSLLVFDAILHKNELIILNESSLSKYNFFIAFISLNYSFSIIFEFLIQRPKRFFTKYNYRKISVLNLQRVTNWFFLNWFVRISFTFGIFAMSYDTKDFFPEIEYIFYLIITVFLGQMWISLRYFLTKNKLRNVSIFISVTLLLTFAISKIEVIDNELIDKSILSKNIIYKYNIQRVTSSSYTSIPHYKPHFFDIYLQRNSNKLIIKTDKKESDLKSLNEQIESFQESAPEYYLSYLSYILHIDKNVKMCDINKIQNSLRELEARRVYYSIKDNNIPFYFSTNKAFSVRLNDMNVENVSFPFLKIDILGQDKFFFQNDTLSRGLLRESLIKKIKVDGVFPFVISYNKNTSFEDYFDVLSLTKSCINQFRNDYAQAGYQQEYESLSSELRKPIREKFYWGLIDDYQKE